MKNTKKIIAIVMAIVTIVSMFAFSASAKTEAKHLDFSTLSISDKANYYGDIDQDGEISLTDVRTCLKACLKKYAFDTSDGNGAAAFYLADYNGDGYITPSDARSILRVSMGLSKPAALPGRVDYSIKSYPVDSSWKNGFYEHNKKNLNWCGYDIELGDLLSFTNKARACNFYVCNTDDFTSFDKNAAYGFYFFMKIDFSKIPDDAVQKTKSCTWSKEFDSAVVKQAKALGLKFDEYHEYHGILFYEDGTCDWYCLNDPDWCDEPTLEVADGFCPYCCKKNLIDGIEFPCTAGGCSRYVIDMTCCFCGEQIYAYQCHTCSVYTYY